MPPSTFGWIVVDDRPTEMIIDDKMAENMLYIFLRCRLIKIHTCFVKKDVHVSS